METSVDDKAAEIQSLTPSVSATITVGAVAKPEVTGPLPENGQIFADDHPLDQGATQRRPVQFNDAIGFVNMVKVRYP